MYNSQFSSPSSSAQFSNNPFIEDPSNPSNRYPDIGTLERSTSGNGYASPGPSIPSYTTGTGYSSYNAGYEQQQGYGLQQQQQQQQPMQQQSYGSWPQQNPVPTSPYGGYGTGAMSPQMTGMPFQSSYGGGPQMQQQQQQYQQPHQQQQYGAAGYASPSPQYGGAGGYQGYAGYGGQPQQVQLNLSEFDPLGSQPRNASSNSSIHTSNLGLGPGGSTHPREYIRAHKRELEMWDSVSWKQALNTFDQLRSTWEAHKGQVELRLRQGGYYMASAEGQRLQSLQKEAEHNVDSIAASSIQMQEVLQGYRQSSDLASKNRVRESLNAALQSLPDWPPQGW